VIDKKWIAQVQYLKETKNFSITKIAEITGRVRSTIPTIFKHALKCIPSNQSIKQDKKKWTKIDPLVTFSNGLERIQGSADIKRMANYFFQNFRFNLILVSGLDGSTTQ